MGLTADNSLNKCCAQLIRNTEHMNAPNTFNEMANFGVLNALESPQNMAGVDMGVKDAIEATYGNKGILDAQGTCAIKVRVRKPTCGASTNEERTELCDLETSGPSDDRVDLDLRITKHFSEHGKFTPEDYQCLCDGGSAEMLQREITKAAKKILKAVNDTYADMVYAAMGNYYNGNASTTSPIGLKLFHESANGFVAQPVGWSPLLLEYRLMQISGGVIAVGGDHAFGYAQALNLTQGINPGAYVTPQGVTVYFDPAVQALGTEPLPNWLLTWAPGALWPMRWFSNLGADKHVPSPDVTRTVIPIFGQLFDLDIQRDAVCDQWIWVLNYTFDLFNYPASLWADCLETNQKQAYQISCNSFQCADFTSDLEVIEGEGLKAPAAEAKASKKGKKETSEAPAAEAKASKKGKKETSEAPAAE